MDCRYCGSDNTIYIGIEDGGGDFGESVCEQWECGECGGLIENCYPEPSEDIVDWSGENFVGAGHDDIPF